MHTSNYNRGFQHPKMEIAFHLWTAMVNWTHIIKTNRSIRFVVNQMDLWRIVAVPFHPVPVTHIQLVVNGNPHMVRDIVLPDVHNVLHLVRYVGGQDGLAGDPAE